MSDRRWWEFDLDGDGVPDVKQGKFWFGLLTLAAKACVRFSPEYTIAHKAGADVLQGVDFVNENRRP